MIPRTLVSFHAHPDDEALLTGGTLAKASAEGHRVVLVVATDGEAGLAADAVGGTDLGEVRRQELAAAAEALGCARLVRLGLADSGWRQGTPNPRSFSQLPIAAAAAGLIDVLREEKADVLTTYDPAGGYGHPDHQQVHLVGQFAAEATRTPTVLQATLPRERLHRAVRIAAAVPGLLDSVDPAAFGRAYTASRELTHRIDVRDHLAAKRRAMQLHASQSTSDVGPRTLSLLLRLPAPIFSLVAGQEYFVQAGHTPGRRSSIF